MKDTTTQPPACDQCGALCVPNGKIDAGYGTDRDGKKHCYACCAAADRETMKRDGKITLYLTQHGDGKWYVTNWPDSLSFPCGRHVNEGRHNIARVQRTAYFCGPNGSPWIARQYGDNTQIAHCRRLKK